MKHEIYDNSYIWYGEVDIHVKMLPIKVYKIWAKIMRVEKDKPSKCDGEDVSIM